MGKLVYKSRSEYGCHRASDKYEQFATYQEKMGISGAKSSWEIVNPKGDEENFRLCLFSFTIH